MARTKFKYNPITCKYEPYFVRGETLRNRIFIFLVSSFIVALAGFFLSVKYFQSFDEMMLELDNSRLKISWRILEERVTRMQSKLDELIQKDDQVYRVILDSTPLPATMREAGTGGSEKLDLNLVKDFSFIVQNFVAIDKLKHQADVEMQSYDELEKILDDKLIAWSARPAIQPINNKELERLHLTYGLRFHPIFKVFKDHKGLDFAAPHGTPIYATGDGKVSMAYFSGSYGNVIYIDHGYDFETRFAHLSRFAVSPGQNVLRGQIIGYVGNTGHSVAPHLHYEILFKGEHINPIGFFQRDLSNSEYQKMIDAAELENGISLD
jgi:murein DD-endopeptidase MepM/ murein hydrolase activator NlpD